MKVTNNTISSTKGSKMKRTLFVAVLATALVFAFAAPALANWGGWTGPDSDWNNTPGADNPYDTAPGSPRQSTSYVQWDLVETLGTDGDFNTPHKGYANTTTLCAVCHSVHFAPVFDGQITESDSYAWTPPSGSGIGTVAELEAAIGGDFNGPAQLLLRSRAATACNFCHVDTAIGNVVVYAGDSDIFGYSQNFTSSYAHDYHNSGCNDCHTVHGANSYAGPLESAILRQQPRGRDPQREVVAALPSSNPAVPALFDTLADVYEGDDILDTGDRYVQQTAFCSSCHYTYTDSSANAVKERGGSASFSKQHPMSQVAPTATPQDAGAKGASEQARTVQWAWNASSTCRSCHSAGLDGTYTGDKSVSAYSEQSFPHYTAGNYRFLDQTFEGEYKTDEVCLSCHRNEANDEGVGFTY